MKPRYASGKSVRFRRWFAAQKQAKRRRANATPPEPEPNPEDPRPAYMQAAVDGYVSQDFGTEWTTDGADTDSGLVTAWPSMNGILSPISFLSPANATINTASVIRAISANSQPRCPDDLEENRAFLLVLKNAAVDSQTKTLITKEHATDQWAIDSRPATLSNYSTGDKFQQSDTGAWTRTNYNTVGVVFDGAGIPTLFLNGSALLPTSPPMTSALYTGTQKWGLGRHITLSNSDFWVADWMIYAAETTPEQMADYTLEAQSRANPA